ncbi:terminase small subunit [Pseudanabaena phage Pan5]|nr:terminase small subunit [Pseudanabaena phage Pan5]
METKLNPKQEQFCREYLIDLNATQAAIRSGYSKRTATAIGAENLTKPNIAARIAELKAKRIEKTEITADYVLTGLKEVAERCLQRVPVMEWDYAQKDMVQKRDENGNGLWEFDSTGANRAFELLGKHVGVFEKDNNQKKQVIKVGISDE